MKWFRNLLMCFIRDINQTQKLMVIWKSWKHSIVRNISKNYRMQKRKSLLKNVMKLLKQQRNLRNILRILLKFIKILILIKKKQSKMILMESSQMILKERTKMISLTSQDIINVITRGKHLNIILFQNIFHPIISDRSVQILKKKKLVKHKSKNFPLYFLLLIE